MKYLLNKTEIAGKRFEGVETTKIATGINGYYGGNVDYFGRTKEGFLLCFYKKTEKIIDILIDEDLLTTDGLKLLLKDQGKEEIPFETDEESVEEAPIPEVSTVTVDVDKMERDELIVLAKKLGIEGKLATFKTAVLIEKIKEAMANEETKE